MTRRGLLRAFAAAFDALDVDAAVHDARFERPQAVAWSVRRLTRIPRCGSEVRAETATLVIARRGSAGVEESPDGG